MIRALSIFSFLYLCIANFTIHAESQPPITQDAKHHTQVALIPETHNIRAGTPFTVGLRLTMEPGWHTYWRDPGESGLATSIRWALPDGWEASEIAWPKPTRIEQSGIVSYGYEGETLLLITITPTKKWPPDVENFTLRARVDWLECKEICLPGRADLSLTLPVTTDEPQTNESYAPLFAAARSTLHQPPEGYSGQENNTTNSPKDSPASATLEIHSLWIAILWAFLGGLILNLMPCVLPVLSLKVLSLLKQATATPWERTREGIAFTIGVKATFIALALALVALRSGGEELGWGFQLQNPWIVAALAILFWIIALNLMGVFTVGAGLVSLQNQPSATPTLWSTLRSGALVVLVATPCTAPFMGAALGYALTRPVMEIILVFAALGAGMALPYFLLCVFPAWLRFVPKPGAWMELLKQALALPMCLAMVWMAWVLGLQLGAHAMAILLLILLFTGSAVYCLGKRQLTTRGKGLWLGFEILFWAFALWLYILLGNVPVLSTGSSSLAESKDGLSWEVYDEDRLAGYREAGRVVFIDFTAAWCLTCKANEAVALNTPETVAFFKEHHIIPMKADWTKRDAVITRALERLGRRSVPVYALYVGKNAPVLLPQILTPAIVRDEIERGIALTKKD